MELDINRVAVTRDGRRMRLLCLDRVGSDFDYPVVGTDLASGSIHSWKADGTTYPSNRPMDIVSQEPATTPSPVRSKIDITRPVKTRSGHEVVILSDKGVTPGRPLVGQWQRKETGDWSTPCTWSPNGQYANTGDSDLDLVQELEFWVVLRGNGNAAVYRGPMFAGYLCSSDKAVIRVPYQLGQRDDLAGTV